jgi:hypothetical protein
MRDESEKSISSKLIRLVIYIRTDIGSHVVSNPSRRRVLGVSGGLVGSLSVGRVLSKEINGSTEIKVTNADPDDSNWSVEQCNLGGTSYAPEKQ